MPRARAALDAFEAILNEPSMWKDFFFEPGQIQLLDNRRCGHCRTGFEDHPEPERRRRLVRLWVTRQRAHLLPRLASDHVS